MPSEEHIIDNREQAQSQKDALKDGLSSWSCQPVEHAEPQYEKAGSTEGANYFYGIYYSIAKDDKIKNKIEGSGSEDKPKKKPFRRRE